VGCRGRNRRPSARRNEERLLVAPFGVLGLYLAVNGVLGLVA
jgi:hypothetical protein